MLRACIAAALAAGLVLAATISAHAGADVQVTDRVFLVRDKPGTPTQFQMIVLAGCGDEAGNQCRGLAHYLEHLVLVGRNPESPDIAVRFFPDARSNGWTNMRATTFIHSMPAREAGPAGDLEKLFTFYAARLREFSITPDEAERERNVVLQEHDLRVGNSPLRQFLRRLDRELIPDHPAGQWVIGTRESIKSFTLDEARAFHRSWYAVNNVYFVVKGDIEPKDLKEIADRALAGLEPKSLPARSTARTPEIPTERKDFKETHAEIKRATVTYRKLVRIAQNDSPSQRAARAVLAGYLTSRLPGSPHAVLVDQDKLAADSPQVSLQRVAKQTFVLTISAEPAPDSSADLLLVAMAKYVDGIAAAPIDAKVVERLKRRSADSWETDAQDPARVFSRLVSWLAAHNSYRSYTEWPGRIAAASPEDIAIITAALSGQGKIVTGIIGPKVEEPAK